MYNYNTPLKPYPIIYFSLPSENLVFSVIIMIIIIIIIIIIITTESDIQPWFP